MEETRTVSLALPLATVYEQAKTRLRTESVAVGIALVAEGRCLVDEDSICVTEESSSSMVGVLQGLSWTKRRLGQRTFAAVPTHVREKSETDYRALASVWRV